MYLFALYSCKILESDGSSTLSSEVLGSYESRKCVRFEVQAISCQTPDNRTLYNRTTQHTTVPDFQTNLESEFTYMTCKFNFFLFFLYCSAAPCKAQYIIHIYNFVIIIITKLHYLNVC